MQTDKFGQLLEERYGLFSLFREVSKEEEGKGKEGKEQGKEDDKDDRQDRIT